MTPAGTSNELDVQNEWEENTHTVVNCTESRNPDRRAEKGCTRILFAFPRRDQQLFSRNALRRRHKEDTLSLLPLCSINKYEEPSTVLRSPLRSLNCRLDWSGSASTCNNTISLTPSIPATKLPPFSVMPLQLLGGFSRFSSYPLPATPCSCSSLPAHGI